MSLTEEQGEALLRYARARLRQELGGPRAQRPAGAWAEARGATFVTLRWRQDGELQGCIGSLEPRRALADDVAHNVLAAALADPRGAPLALPDVDALEIEISLLSALEPLACSDEASALAALRPGEDGLVLACGAQRATLLPAMWEQLDTPAEFLSALRRKAGCAPGWREGDRLWRYTTERYRDAEAHP